MFERSVFRQVRPGRVVVSAAFSILPIVLLLVLSACATAPQPEALVIRNGTLIDGTGAGPVADAALVIEGGTIRAAGPEADLTLPDDARVVDAEGGYIIPGLIDAHVHYSQTGWFDGRPDALDLRDRYPYPKVVAELKANPERFFEAYLCSGVTATFDVGGYPWTRDLMGDDSAQASDESPQPNVEASGPLLSTLDFWLNLPNQKQFVHMADEEIVRETVRSHADERSSAIKVWFITSQLPDSARAVRLVRAAGEEAARAGLPFLVHATGLWEAKEAVRAGADVLVHSVFAEPVDEEFLRLARESGVIYTPTITVQEGYRNAFQSKAPGELPYPTDCVDAETIEKLEGGIPEELRPAWAANMGDTPPPTLRQAISNLERVHAEGITVATGTDAGNPGTLHGPSIFREMELMAQAGMSPMDVLIASTRNGAHAMNRGDDLGTLEVGKAGDVVVLAENPLENMANFRTVQTVIKGGEIVRP